MVYHSVSIYLLMVTVAVVQIYIQGYCVVGC